MSKIIKQMTISQQAMKYHAMGYSVIPVKQDKRPALASWKKYQEEQASIDEVVKWFKDNKTNIGIVTGRVSGITVIDIDTKSGQADEMLAKFPPTLTVQTPSKGYHLYYQYAEGFTVSANAYAQFPNVDIRGDTGYVLACPSRTEKGEYKVIKDIAIAPFPIHLFPQKKPRRTLTEMTTAKKGSRNDNLTAFTGKLLQATKEEEWYTEALPAVQRTNKTFENPLPDDEVLNVFNSIAKKEKQRRSELIVSPLQMDDGSMSEPTAIKLHRNKNNTPYCNMANVILTLEQHPYYKGTIKYNTFKHIIEYNGAPLEDSDIIKIQYFLQTDMGLSSITKDATYSGIIHYAHQNKYDEAQEWLKSLQWDGKPRLEEWLPIVTHVENDEYHRSIGMQWWLGMVKRIMIPGVQWDYMLVVTGAQGVGKAEWVENIVPTPDGMKRFGDLKAGDFVFGSNGLPNRVLQTFPQGLRKLYKVTMNDNSFVYVDGDHLWTVYDRNNHTYKGKKGEKGKRSSIFIRTPKKVTITTKEILKNGLYIKNGGCPFFRYSVPSNNPVEGKIFIENKYAYALGCWLGDGTISEGSITNESKEVWDKLRLLGWDFKDYPKKSTQSVTLYGLTKLIRKMDLWNKYSFQKYIPEECFNWNIEARKELLAGLLDTDGECGGNSKIGYCSTSKKLIDDVIKLVRGLGGKATEAKVKKTTHKDAYRTSISLDWNPFTVIKCKKERWIKPTQQHERTIKDISYSHDGEAMCIKVEAEDELYLTKDYIVTHNTSLFRIIGGDWYKSYTGGLETKDMYLAMRGCIIFDLDEGATMYKSEVIKLKSIITETHDEFRAPYDKVTKKYPRRFVFSMSTNDATPFQDITGNRRYWVLDMPDQMVDFKWIEENREQLFAEAYHYFKNKIETLQVPIEVALQRQADHLPDDAWSELVCAEVRKSADYCEGNENYNTTIMEVFNAIFTQESSLRVDRKIEMRIGNIFRKDLGLEKRQKMVDGERRNRWYITDRKIKKLKENNAKKTESIDDLTEEEEIEDSTLF